MGIYFCLKIYIYWDPSQIKDTGSFFLVVLTCFCGASWICGANGCPSDCRCCGDSWPPCCSWKPLPVARNSAPNWPPPGVVALPSIAMWSLWARYFHFSSKSCDDQSSCVLVCCHDRILRLSPFDAGANGGACDDANVLIFRTDLILWKARFHYLRCVDDGAYALNYNDLQIPKSSLIRYVKIPKLIRIKIGKFKFPCEIQIFADKINRQI